MCDFFFSLLLFLLLVGVVVFDQFALIVFHVLLFASSCSSICCFFSLVSNFTGHKSVIRQISYFFQFLIVYFSIFCFSRVCVFDSMDFFFSHALCLAVTSLQICIDLFCSNIQYDIKYKS